MNFNTRLKRTLSILLVLVMVFTMFPVSVSAANADRTADTIFFASDLHNETSKLQSLLKALSYEPGLVVLAGDHVNNTDSGSLASITSTIHGIYPGVQTYYTYAAHDPNVSADSTNPYAFANTGEVYTGEDYYVYALDQGAMQSASTASSASAAFKNWAAGADASKVIFVVCHMPIHQRRGDNAGGATWMTALNEVGQTHDVVFLWGHNHTGENSSDTSVYFVGVGGSLTPQGGSTGTINFTYMNAGYIKNGYASMVVIDDSAVHVTRYTTSGSVNATHTFERRFGQTHNWETTEYVAPTCTTPGYKTTVCTDCGESKTSAIAATGHEYTSVVLDTCVGSSTVYTCSNCGHSYSEQNPTETTYDAVSSLTEGESYVIVVSNYALTHGSSAGKTSVSVSSDSITSNVTDAMIWTYRGGMLYNEASGTYINYSGSSSRKTITFSSTGASVSFSSSRLKLGSYYLYYSSSSGFSARSSGSTVKLYQVNEAFGGSGAHTYTSHTVAPTCTVDGSVTYTCTSCGDTYTEVIPAGGNHSYASVTVDATCDKDGSVTYTCTSCGDSYTDVIPALGHSYEAVVTAPTCTEEGFTTYTCNCGHSYVGNYVAALGHTYASVTVEATCTKEGTVTYTCDCGDTYTEKLPAPGHSHEAVVTAPTCTEQGYTTYTCACGDSYIADYVEATGHSYESVTVAPTCTAKGSVTYTCDCGESYCEEIPALGHNHEAVVTAPTCTEEGYTTYTCHCGDSYIADYVEATGHNYESVTVAPTCTEGGYTGNTCSICGNTTITDEIPALGHNHEAVVTAPTCTEDGYTTYTCHCGHSYVADQVAALGHTCTSVVTEATCTEQGFTTHTCSVCGDVTVDSYVAALGHEKETVTVPATCTETGSVTSTCVRCGETSTQVIPALGHNHEAVVTAPTCTEGGYTTYTCHCGDSYIADEVAALGHHYDVVTVAATCTADGSHTYTCDCGESYTEIIHATGHSYVSVTTEATCTEAGCTTHTCVNCGDSYITDEIPAFGHSYETVVTAPTCTEGGYTTYTCHCGDSYIADEVAALGHNHEAVVTAPTCTEGGYTTYTCHCGDSYVADEIPALGHSHTAVTIEPTCTTDGSVTYTCACGDTYTEVLKAIGHSYSVAESNGYMVYTCDHCGHSYSEAIETELSYVQASSMGSGNSYIITFYSNRKYYALSHENNQISVVQVTVSNGEITSEITDDLVWTYAGSKLSYEANGTTYYLYASSSNSWWGSWFGGSLSISSSNSSTVTFSSSKLKVGSMYLRYSGGSVSLNRSASTTYVFKETAE